MPVNTYKTLFPITIAAFFTITIVYLYNLDQRIQRIESTQDIYTHKAQLGIKENNQNPSKSSNKKPSTTPITEYLNASENTPENKLIYGNLNARITLTMLSDMDCPYCKKMHPNLKKLVDSSEGVLNWEYRHLPLKRHNPSATNKAMLVECVNKAEGNRAAWSTLNALVSGHSISDLAIGELATCIENNEKKAELLEDMQYAEAINVMSTPVIIVTDNETGKQGMLKGYKEPQHIVKAIEMVMGI
jgi:protein-disulfide isomerase